MKVLSIGNFQKISNTCLHRHWALEELSTEIDKVELYNKISIIFKIINRLFISFHIPISLPDQNNSNSQIKKLISNKKYDLVWIDKGLTINPSSLIYIKKCLPSAKIVSYTADNMSLRHNQSENFLKCIPFYDFHITTKSFIVDDLKQYGAKNVIFTYQSYESRFHFSRELSVKEKEKFGGDVGFVGVWEEERCQSILFLVDNGIKVKVFGDGNWNKYKNYHKNLQIFPGIFSEDYSKALQAFKITLCFLRKINKDLHTSRSLEIPACGGFMLGERTKEHLELFREGVEAEYFSNNTELLEKCKYYLKNENQRISILTKGHDRIIKSGYSNKETIKRLIDNIGLNINK